MQEISRNKKVPKNVANVSDGSYLQTVIDNLPVALFAKDAGDDFRFVLWNKEQERVTTIPREKALGKVDSQIFSAEIAEYFRDVDRAVVKRGKKVVIAEEIIDTDEGGEIYLKTVKVPIRDEERDRTLLVGISEDITERVEAREQLKKLNENLFEKNKELESTQMQLIQAAKMESIGRLAAGVAHEVKNPLAMLLMGVEYLDSGIDPDDENIEIILNEMREAIERGRRHCPRTGRFFFGSTTCEGRNGIGKFDQSHPFINSSRADTEFGKCKKRPSIKIYLRRYSIPGNSSKS